MTKIFEISEDIKQIISASEVIEDVSSVIKELVENSLDSGAKTIEIDIEASGMSLIKVKDDGCGMTPSEIELSIKKFHTSKTKDIDDAYIPRKLGFRGEALYSIASISRMSVISREHSSDDTWRLEFIEGKLISKKPQRKIDGTEVSVERLFFNTPGRKDFLKSQKHITSKIKKIVQQFSIVYKDVKFIFRSSGRTIFGSDIPYTENLKALLRVKPSSSCIEGEMDLHLDTTLYKLNYCIYPSDKGEVLVSLNNRLISIPWLLSVVRKSYGKKTKNYKQNFSFFFRINVEKLRQGLINFNYHPRKNEVFFLQEEALKIKVFEQFSSVFEKYMEFDKFNFDSSNPDFLDVDNRFLGSALGQIHNSWIISQTDSEMFIIDQHAAHERILLEKMKSAILQQYKDKGENFPSISLSNRVFIDDSIATIYSYERITNQLNRMGFRFSIEGESLFLTNVPSIFVENLDWENFFVMYFHKFSLNIECVEETILEMIYDLANKSCKMAIKASKKLSLDEVDMLLRDMERYPSSLFCNHGRPTVKKLTKNQLESFFER